MTDPLRELVSYLDAEIPPAVKRQIAEHREKVEEANSQAGRVMVRAYCPLCSKRPKFDVVDTPAGPLVRSWFIPHGMHVNDSMRDGQGPAMEFLEDAMGDPTRPAPYCAVHGLLEVSLDELRSAVARFRSDRTEQKIPARRLRH